MTQPMMVNLSIRMGTSIESMARQAEAWADQYPGWTVGLMDVEQNGDVNVALCSPEFIARGREMFAPVKHGYQGPDADDIANLKDDQEQSHEENARIGYAFEMLQPRQPPESKEGRS